MIQLACAHCGTKLKVRDEHAGRSGHCPTCKKVLTVPSAVPATIALEGYRPGTPSSLRQAEIDAGVQLRRPGDATNDRAGDASSAVADLLAGRARTGSRYVVEKEIARGGMGAVVRAVDCDIRREVAVKYMLREGDRDQKVRFVEEAQITGQLEHPNIVPIHELGVDGRGRLFFAMKMVRGRSLAQVLEELRKSPRTAERQWTLTRLLSVLTNVCYALAYAHSRGVIHRDLKPANIMLGDFGETYVMDWGLAKVLDRKLHESSSSPVAGESHSEFSVRTLERSAGGSASTRGGSASSEGDSTKVVTSNAEEALKEKR